MCININRVDFIIKVILQLKKEKKKLFRNLYYN